jgi:hypothetical protein
MQKLGVRSGQTGDIEERRGNGQKRVVVERIRERSRDKGIKGSSVDGSAEFEHAEQGHGYGAESVGIKGFKLVQVYEVGCGKLEGLVRVLA